MDLQKDDAVTVLTPNNSWSKFACTIIEELADNDDKGFYRLKFPNGEIKRVYHDRVRPFAMRDTLPESSNAGDEDVDVLPPKKIKPPKPVKQPKPSKQPQSEGRPMPKPSNAAAAAAPAVTPAKPKAAPAVEGQFNPWAKCPSGQVYVKENSFNASTVCKTIVIIDEAAGKYYSVNTYNGLDRGMCDYDLADSKKIVHRLTKKGYALVAEADWK